MPYKYFLTFFRIFRTDQNVRCTLPVAAPFFLWKKGYWDPFFLVKMCMPPFSLAKKILARLFLNPARVNHKFWSVNFMGDEGSRGVGCQMSMQMIPHHHTPGRSPLDPTPTSPHLFYDNQMIFADVWRFSESFRDFLDILG